MGEGLCDEVPLGTWASRSPGERAGVGSQLCAAVYFIKHLRAPCMTPFRAGGRLWAHSALKCRVWTGPASRYLVSLVEEHL